MNKSQTGETVQKALSELDEVKAILIEREQQHGSPDKNFKAIAQLWSAYLGTDVSEMDVALMMTLFKVGRLSTSGVNRESLRDLIGYPVLAISLAK